MAITNFIPTIWSETLYTELDKKYIAVSHCNREFEGDIKGRGATVKICGVGDVSIGDYTKNTDMGEAQTLSDTVRELTIDQAKYFNFQIDDIDKAQCTPKLMEAAMKLAASGLANEADKFIYNMYDQAGSILDVSESLILEGIIEGRRVLFEKNVSDSDEVIVEVSPAVAKLIMLKKIDLVSNNDNIVETGCIGSIAGCKIFVSNNVKVIDNAGTQNHKCIMRTKRAIAFAEQLSEINAYRPEKRFADAVKGLYLFGGQVVYPNEMVLLDVQVYPE
jgi:hypothetical protein